jgi:4'-phosphopantetheinyl transferase
VPLDRDANDDAYAVLSRPEHRRLRLRSGPSALRFARAHAGLRRVLATYLNSTPHAVRLHTSYGEPPRLRGARLAVSLTHSGELALVAVARTAVGIDIESLGHAASEADELEWMAALTLSDAELAAFYASPTHERAVRWLQSWTRKEAWLKAHSRGIGTQPPARIDVSTDLVQQHALVDLVPATGYVAAVALAHPSVLVDWKELAV